MLSVVFLLVCLCVPVHSALVDDPATQAVLWVCIVFAIFLAGLVAVLFCLLSRYYCDGKMPSCRCSWVQVKRRGNPAVPDTLSFSVDRQTAVMLDQLFNDGPEEPATVKQNAPIVCGSTSEPDTLEACSPVTRTFNVGRQTPGEVGRQTPGEVVPTAANRRKEHHATITVDTHTHNCLQQMYDDMDDDSLDEMDDDSLDECPAVPPYNPTDEDHASPAMQAPNIYQPLLHREEVQEVYQEVVRDNYSDTTSEDSYQNAEVFLGRQTGP